MSIAHGIPKYLKPQRCVMFIAVQESLKYLKPQWGDMFIAHGKPKYLKPQRGNMFIEVESVKYLAPAGRHVYSTRDAQKS